MANTTVKHGHARSGKHTATYNTWRGMLRRCTTPGATGYESYGGRGIKVCDRWLESFENFLTDIRPEGKTLDRENPDGDYTPENCRWASAREQSNNRGNNRLVTLGNRTQTLSQWATECGIGKQTLKERLDAGWAEEDAIMTPVRSKTLLFEYQGRMLSVRELSEIANVPYCTLWNRLNAGWGVEQAISVEANNGNGWKNYGT